ncbi:MAG: CDP-glycerol glycerophosphotransferase family protein [Clostridia bacterium]|nr:CDP-glycerol glycerophosphotransferase family protein [Clostridia bacterium]
MKKKLITILKRNKLVYKVYNFIMSIFWKFIGIFCPIDEKLILFNSFGGKKYDDNTRATYEYMISSGKYNDYKMIWALDNIKLGEKYNLNVVKNNSFKFFITALKAKYWISNSSMERGLKFKKNKTIYILMMHGTPMKKMGFDAIQNDFAFKTSEANIIYAQSKFEADTFIRAFKKSPESYKIVGYPRNDYLCNYNEKDIDTIKRKLNIQTDKKVILYAPTFRDFNYDANGCFIAPPIDLDKWKKELGEEYLILFRAHYEVNKVLNIQDNEFIKNVTNYEKLDELMIISDILISDYSSIIFDYSILERPIYSFAYDFEEYSEKRGLYEQVVKDLPNGVQKSEDELINKIKNCEFGIQKEITKKFRNKYVEVYGNASKYIDSIVLNDK